MSIDRGDSGEWLHAFNRDRLLSIEARLRETERELIIQSHGTAALAREFRAAMARIRRLEERPAPLTADEMVRFLWNTLWFRGLLIVALLNSNISVERLTKLARLLQPLP
jgi:hypothetical protein